MGRYDKEIASSQAMLAEAQEKYESARVSMADAVPHVRQHVLDFYQAEIEEANRMIDIFRTENERE